jgi:hypothetical protein
VITDHLLPGRWDEVRPPLAKELNATMVLALSLDEASVKIANGPPDDSADDIASDAWAGVVPFHTTFDAPVPAPDLRPGIAFPASIAAMITP